MRILFTFAGGSGHLEPLLPLAAAAQLAGHDVAFVGRPWMVPKVEALRYTAFAAGTDRGLTPRRLPLAKVDVAQDMQGLAAGFGQRLARERAADILPLCAAWRPDLLVSEEVDYGAMLVAERIGLPYATVLVIAEGSFVQPKLVAAALQEVRQEHGLPADAALRMPRRFLVLSPFPPRFRNPAYPLPRTAHAVRLTAPDRDGHGTPPPWIASLNDAPTVYFTLGTIYNMESGDLFHRVLAGLRQLPINIVVTVGRDIDPAELGPQPPNVYVERYVPQAAILPWCDAVVSHGGSGTVIGSLAHGLPAVLLPLGADQPMNAARCVELGVARVLDAHAVSPELVREAVAVVLADQRYRDAARAMRDEIAALPGPAHALALLERLAAEQGPLIAA